MAVEDWSSTASNNTSVGGLTTDGNIQTVNNIDGMFRGMMADIRTGINAGQFVNPAKSVKSGNYTAVVADRGDLIQFSATATLSLTAAATLGAGWQVTVFAGSGATVTIDPNGSETINSQSTLTIDPANSVVITCDGSNFFAATSLDEMRIAAAGIGRYALIGGLLVQWGFNVDTTSAGGGITHTLPTAFSNTNFTVVAMSGDSGLGNIICSEVMSAKSTTTFGILYRTANTGAVIASAALRTNWVAIGSAP